MLPFDEALARVLEGASVLAAERVPVGEALGRVLAQDLHASEALPPFDYSAMDGYAVHTRAFDGDGPWRLPVRGESRTGAPPPPLIDGTACRIFTGAELPAGANCVVMQEDVQRDGGDAVFRGRPSRFDNVRRRGEDLLPGALALAAGARLGPGQIGLAAALDRAEVSVARRPRVSIVCTGDELRRPGDPIRPGSIPDSNGVALAALVKTAGAHAVLAPLARDDHEATRRAIALALTQSDVLVTVGGVSVGDHDVVKSALEAAGAELAFWKVRIKPGKPLLSGRAGSTRVLGLPGNPASALVTFALFGMPLLRALQGDSHPVPGLRRLRLGAALRQKPGRRGFYRALLGPAEVTPLENQASGAPTSMAWADALIVVHEDSTGYDAGSEVDVLALADL